MTTHLTSSGHTFLIRRPEENDAQAIIDYSRKVFVSTDQVLTTPEEYNITLESEKIWINNFNINPDALALVAEENGDIVGLLFFMPNTKKKNLHTGEFGVNVHPDFQRLGIGRKLIEMLIAWAKENNRIEKIFLNVFASNHNAIKLYKAIGFTEEGRHIKAIKQPTGEYVDILQMYIETKGA